MSTSRARTHEILAALEEVANVLQATTARVVFLRRSAQAVADDARALEADVDRCLEALKRLQPRPGRRKAK